MVMQQDKPLIVWGWAQPNEKVTVELSGGSQQVQANDRGEWKAVLPERGHGKGLNRRLEFEPGAWFEGSCGLTLVLALSQMREHGLGPFGRADLRARRNPLDRQGRFAPQPGSDGWTTPAICQVSRDEPRGPARGYLPGRRRPPKVPV